MRIKMYSKILKYIERNCQVTLNQFLYEIFNSTATRQVKEIYEIAASPESVGGNYYTF